MSFIEQVNGKEISLDQSFLYRDLIGEAIEMIDSGNREGGLQFLRLMHNEMKTEVDDHLNSVLKRLLNVRNF